MRYEATVTAFDVLDQVWVVVSLRGSDGVSTDRSALLGLQRQTTVQGTGETDPREWLRDALIAAIETL